MNGTYSFDVFGTPFYSPFGMNAFPNPFTMTDTYQNTCIVDVYKNNLNEEMTKLSKLIDDFPYVSMDTEFPGFQSQASMFINDSNDPNCHYRFMKSNVDSLKVIQVGITLQNEKGEYPDDVRAWQFNFKFDIDNDECQIDSIHLLQKAGINFNLLKTIGITEEDFGEIMTVSGLVLNEKTHWLTFHSGYDFAYMLRLLTGEKLPETIDGFITKLRIFFPNLLDLKHVIMKVGQTYLGNSLQAIATGYGVQRVGSMHQAGSDSLITGGLYFKFIEKHTFDEEEFNGILFGLNDS